MTLIKGIKKGIKKVGLLVHLALGRNERRKKCGQP